jgi:hypothetical protein
MSIPIRAPARTDSETVRLGSAQPAKQPVAPIAKPRLALVWQGAEYPFVEPGLYRAKAVGIIGPDYLAQYGRYSLGVAFQLIDMSNIEVFCFLNLGGDGKPCRRSNFFKAWSLANGQPPQKGQTMDPTVFLQGQIFEVKVGDNVLNSDGERKSEAEVYSVVRKIIRMVDMPERANRRRMVREILKGAGTS